MRIFWGEEKEDCSENKQDGKRTILFENITGFVQEGLPNEGAISGNKEAPDWHFSW